ncbi:MAG: BamA/TamA family outer membrane protein [Saprospiraceae bacterium]|nr:BamA/TamA family outer membrane protein [Saprospiraceae bacterium]
MNKLVVLFFLTLFFPFITIAQIENDSFKVETYSVLDYSSPKEFEIGGVSIVGVKDRDPNAIAGYAGLMVGKKIVIPGQDISGAIKALWKIKLFTDVRISIEKTIGEIVFLEINLKERPTLSRFSYKGVKKSSHEDLNDELKGVLVKGGIITDDVKILAENKIKEFYFGKGFLNTKVDIKESPDEEKANTVKLLIDIKKNERVRVDDIYFVGNKDVNDKTLRKKMKKVKKVGTIFKKSKFIESEFEEDKKSIIAYYNKLGFRDARIIADTIGRTKNGNLAIQLRIFEGDKYRFNNITWKGNSIYADDVLNRVLGIQKGDVYNSELLDKRLKFSLDGRDVSSLYMDKGYLFFRVDPNEVAVDSAKIDIEMRIYEGPQATIDKVVIKGNDRTNEKIVRRELRTFPGEKFSRSDIIRSQREIINLGYFNPESLGINTPVNPQQGTVDIEYTVEEKPSDQLEMSAGYSGYGGLLGTLGVVFNNFSIENVSNRSSWNPLPQGDGQKLSLRVQSNNYYKSINFSFTEPWFGGRTRNSLTVGGVYSKYGATGSGFFASTRGFAGLGIPLKWPDDYFLTNITLNMEKLELEEFTDGNFAVNSGTFNNLSLNLSLLRSSISEPIYPRSGSKILLSLKVTPPYSMFRTVDYTLTEEEKQGVIETLQSKKGDGTVLSDSDKEIAIRNEVNRLKFNWLEYHKWKIESEWYFNIIGNLVFMSSIKMGFLGSYDKDIGLIPFERYEIGGDGLSNYSANILGKDIYSLRGYETTDFNQNAAGGAPIFSKYTVELRYPVTLNPSSTIYGLLFAQAGNSWSKFRDFNPFDVKRSFGVGLRAYLPMFGLLGFDYGFGIDKDVDESSKWSSYGKFSVILGFEPE